MNPHRHPPSGGCAAQADTESVRNDRFARERPRQGGVADGTTGTAGIGGLKAPADASGSVAGEEDPGAALEFLIANAGRPLPAPPTKRPPSAANPR